MAIPLLEYRTVYRALPEVLVCSVEGMQVVNPRFESVAAVEAELKTTWNLGNRLRPRLVEWNLIVKEELEERMTMVEDSMEEYQKE